VERGAEFFSEFIIYSVAGATVIYEYRLNERQKEEKTAEAAEKERRRRAEMAMNEEKQWRQFAALNQRLEAMETEIRTLREQQAADERRNGRRRWFFS